MGRAGLKAKPALEVRGLTRTYPGGAGVRDVSFTLAPGEIVALVGPNGAGKTTLLEALAGEAPHGGKVRVQGIPQEHRAAFKARLAYLPEDRGFPTFLTGRTAARLAQELWLQPGFLARFEEERGRWQLSDADLDRPALTLSQGTREKLALALVFSRKAPVYVLDEPEAHLDPIVRAELEDRLGSLKAAGKAVLFATHDVHLAARLGDRVLVVRSGRVRALAETKADAILRAVVEGRAHEATD